MNFVDPVEALPLELFTEVLLYLSWNDWCNAKQVSKSWNWSIEKHVWASNVSSDILKRSGDDDINSNFNAGTLKRCLKLVFGGDSTVGRIERLALLTLRNEYEGYDYALENCLNLLNKETCQYKGKSIGALRLATMDGVRTKYLTNLVPITDLSICNGGFKLAAVDLQGILESQRSSLWRLSIWSKDIYWKDSFETILWKCPFLNSVSLCWTSSLTTLRTPVSTVLFALFRACPNIKLARFGPCRLDARFPHTVCLAICFSKVESLYINNTDENLSSDTHSLNPVERPEYLPKWPARLSSLKLYGIDDWQLERVRPSGSLLLRTLTIGRSNITLKYFVTRFCSSPQFGYFIKYLSLPSKEGKKGSSRLLFIDCSEISLCKSIVYLDLRYQLAVNSSLELFLHRCPFLRYIDLGHTCVTRRGLLSLAKHGCKIIGIQGLQVSRGVIQEVESYGAKCVKGPIEYMW